MAAGLGALALYVAAAALGLALAHRLVSPIRFRIALLLAAAPLLLTGKAFVTGGVYAPIDILYDFEPLSPRRASLGVGPTRTPILGDVVTLNIPWREAVRASLRRGELPLWNPYALAGDPLFAMQQPAVLHPINVMGLLPPLPQAITFEAAARVLLALLCGYLFFADLVPGEPSRLVGAVAWGLSDYFAFSLGCPHALAVAPFPLLALGLRRLARSPERRGVGITLTALVAMILAGHPETLLHSVAGAGLYFLFELSGAPPGRRLRSVGCALLAGGWALGIGAVVLLPLAETEPLTAEHAIRTLFYAHAKRSVAWPAVLQRLTAQAVPWSFGVSGHGRLQPGFEVPAAYSGALLLPLAATGALGSRRCRWFFLGLAAAVLAVCTKTPAADLLAKLPLFDIAINEYTIFLATFSICALAALGAERLERREAVAAFALSCVVVAVLISLVFLGARPRLDALGMPAAYARGRLILATLPLLLAAALVWARLARPALPAVSAIAAMFAAQRLLEAGSLYPTLPEKAFYPTIPVLERIPREAPYRFAAVGTSLIPNIPTVYGLQDVRGYEAMKLARLVQTFPLWSVNQGVWFNRVDDPTRPFLSFLNARWFLMPVSSPVPEGWSVAAEDDRLRLVENPGALERAVVPREYRGDPDAGVRLALLGGIPDFRERGVLDEDTAGAWKTNGRAVVAVEPGSPARLALLVTALDAAVVGTSLVAWPGWRVEVDGRRVPVIAYNHAFVGFRVPAGRHRVVARYLPESFVRGLAVSLACSGLLVAAALRRPRRSRPEEPALPSERMQSTVSKADRS